MNKYVTIGIILVVMLVLSYLLKAAVVIGVIGTVIIALVAFVKKDKNLEKDKNTEKDSEELKPV